MDIERLKHVLEALLLAAGRPLSLAQLENLLAGGDGEAPSRSAIREALALLATEWEGRSLVLQEVASGYRAQVRDEYEPWVARLWAEKPPRYTRALLETLAIIAYRQPVTRPEIEDIRGVSVSSQIMRTLQEREWVRVVGHRDAPGRPAMFGTTRQFLDHFNLKTLDQLPTLAEIRDLGASHPQLAFEPGSTDGDQPSAGDPADEGGVVVAAGDGDTVGAGEADDGSAEVVIVPDGSAPGGDDDDVVSDDKRPDDASPGPAAR